MIGQRAESNERDQETGTFRYLGFRFTRSFTGWLNIRLDDGFPLGCGWYARPYIWHEEQDAFNAVFQRRDSVVADLGYAIPKNR